MMFKKATSDTSSNSGEISAACEVLINKNKFASKSFAVNGQICIYT